MKTPNNNPTIVLLTFMLLIGSCVSISAAIAEDSYVPIYHPTLDISKTSGIISIDGVLDDPGWIYAGRADNFAEHRPGDQTKPPVKTIALITYDDQKLYVAMICNDDPSNIRASFCNRDQVFSDDNICLLIDTYGNAAWAYEFNVNPYGIQGDLLWSKNGGENSGYDMIWQSAGQITDSGYQVEIAIPFSSLRFPNREKQIWKVDFWRNHPRETRRQYSWAAYDRDEPCWPCQWGTITGIENVQPGKGIELLPTIIAYQSGALTESGNPDSPFENENPDGQISLGAKYSITSDITAEATYNPDFSQIESDADQIDVNTNVALFYQERRPFFQEGSDLFNTYFSAVYTRSINNPQFAAKLTGRMGRTSIAYLAARDKHSPIMLPFEECSEIVLAEKSFSNIARVRHTFGDDSHLGLIMTDRRFDGGGSGTLAGADGMLRLSKNYSLEMQVMTSHTTEPDDTVLTSDLNGETFDNGSHTSAFDGESFGGHGIYASFERHGRNSDFDLDYLEKSPAFRADLGFGPINNRRMVELFAGYTFYTNSSFFEFINPVVVVGRVWNFAKEKKDEWLVTELNTRMPGQTFVSVSFLESWEKLRSVEFSGIRRFSFSANSNFSDPVGLGFEFEKGHLIARQENPPTMGNETHFSVWGYIKPLDRIRIEPSFNFAKSENLETGEEFFEGFITRMKLNFQLTRKLSLRLVTQYNDFNQSWDIDPLLTYRMSSFSVFYIGSTYNYGNIEGKSDIVTKGTFYNDCWKVTSRQFFFKLQYLFQM